MTKAFVVLGCHRSATSLVAKGLHECGVDMGSPSLEADRTQPHGYYEHAELVALNERILSQMGARWDHVPERLTYDDVDRGPIEEYVLARSMAGSAMWGMKDPRLVLTWPVFQPFVEQLNDDVHVIAISRTPERVVESLQRRDHGDPPDGWSDLYWDYHELLLQRMEDLW